MMVWSVCDAYSLESETHKQNLIMNKVHLLIDVIAGKKVQTIIRKYDP